MELRVLNTGKVDLYNTLDFLSRNGLYLAVRDLRGKVGALVLRVGEAGSVIWFGDGQDFELIERKTGSFLDSDLRENGYLWQISSTLPGTYYVNYQ